MKSYTYVQFASWLGVDAQSLPFGMLHITETEMPLFYEGNRISKVWGLILGLGGEKDGKGGRRD